jgi:hypothetical protein
MAPIPDDWTNISDEPPHRRRAAALYKDDGRLHLHLPTLARLWLQKLAEVGLYEIDRSSGSPPKELASYYPRAEPLHTDIYPVKLSDSREVLWLKLNGRRSERGYRSVEVLDTPLRTNTSILAALTAVEAQPIDTELLSKVLSHKKAPFNEPIMLHVRDLPRELKREFLSLIVDHPTPDYVVALLRYYRPEFDDLPHKEKLALIEEGCARINTFLGALRHLEAFLEYGVPEQDLRSRMEKAQEDIKAAELKDVEGLSNPTIGKILGIFPTPSDQERRENSQVRTSVKRGRPLLIDAFGEEGWRKQVEAKKVERDWFFSLDEEERDILLFADELGISVEEARTVFDITKNEQEQDSADDRQSD